MGAIDNYLAKRLNAPRIKGFDGLAELLQQQDDARQAQRVRSKKKRHHSGSSSHGTESSKSTCDCRPGKLFLAGGWPEICPRCGELLRFSIG